LEEAGGFPAQEAEEDDDHTQPWRKLVAVLRKLRSMMIILNPGGSWWLSCSGS
jgi:hypothetical protein